MSDNKKYYYLKMKEDFFSREEIKIIKGIDQGHRYICILQEMYLRSLKRDGMLVVDDGIPYDVEMLSSVMGENCAHIEKAIEIFKRFKLIEILDDGSIYMSHIQSFIGNSSTEADRIREYRKKIDKNNGFVQIPYKCTPELELERKIKIELETKPNGVSKKPLKKIDHSDYTIPHGDAFKSIWSEWLEYRTEKRIPYKSQKSIIRQLDELASVPEDVAVAMVAQSIKSGWQGIFPIDKKQRPVPVRKSPAELHAEILAKVEGRV